MSGNSNTSLHQKWVLWYDNPRLAPPGSSWKDNLQKCGTFDNVGDFWSIFNNVKPASQLPLNSNYHIFREGVEPMWEDPENKNGGKFVLTIPKKDSQSGRCDEWWLYTVLSVIGETLDVGGNEVCGAVVSIRKSQDRIALWLKSSNKRVCVAIGERWKKALGMNKTQMRFQLHNDGAYWDQNHCGLHREAPSHPFCVVPFIRAAAASGSSFRNEVKFSV